jgi:hypothetical protein
MAARSKESAGAFSSPVPELQALSKARLRVAVVRRSVFRSDISINRRRKATGSTVPRREECCRMRVTGTPGAKFSF